MSDRMGDEHVALMIIVKLKYPNRMTMKEYYTGLKWCRLKVKLYL